MTRTASHSIAQFADRLPWVSLGLVATAAAAWAFPASADWLQYDRAAVAGGELWRVVTCHFAHWSAEHLFWDAVALLALGWIIEGEHRKALSASVAVSAVLIPATIWFCTPEMATYRGLSGIDSAVFLLVAAAVLRESLAAGDRLLGFASAGVLAGFAAKVALEMAGLTLFVDAGAARMEPVPLAHVVGAVVGGACALRRGCGR